MSSFLSLARSAASGATAIEYALIMAGIAGAILVATMMLGGDLYLEFIQIADAV